MSRRRSIVPLLACAGGLLLAPAAASAAPALTLDRACYLSASDGAQEVLVAGTGFAPRERVTLVVDGQAVGDVQAGDDGTFDEPVKPDQQPAGRREVRVEARSGDAVRAAATASLSALTVSLTPRRANPSDRVLFRARGFVPLGLAQESKFLYAHYLRGERLVATVKLGRLSGPCGTLKAKAQQIPVRKVRSGTYTIQFDRFKAYSPDAVPRVRLDLKVTVPKR